jgi:hypothetical protein
MDVVIFAVSTFDDAHGVSHAETIINFGGEGNSRPMRMSFCVTANSSSN